MPFALRYRVGLAVTIALITYFAWAVLLAVPSAAFGLAAAFGNRASRAVVESSISGYAAGWTWALVLFGVALIVVLIARARFTTAAATAWFLSLAVLVALSSITYGFTWLAIPTLVCAFLIAVYSGIAARAA